MSGLRPGYLIFFFLTLFTLMKDYLTTQSKDRIRILFVGNPASEPVINNFPGWAMPHLLGGFSAFYEEDAAAQILTQQKYNGPLCITIHHFRAEFSVMLSVFSSDNASVLKGLYVYPKQNDVVELQDELMRADYKQMNWVTGFVDHQLIAPGTAGMLVYFVMLQAGGTVPIHPIHPIHINHFLSCIESLFSSKDGQRTYLEKLLGLLPQ